MVGREKHPPHLVTKIQGSVAVGCNKSVDHHFGGICSTFSSKLPTV